MGQGSGESHWALASCSVLVGQACVGWWSGFTPREMQSPISYMHEVLPETNTHRLTNTTDTGIIFQMYVDVIKINKKGTQRAAVC